MPEAEKARKPRATAEDKARAKRIERLAFRLAMAQEQIGQVWRDADFNGDIQVLKGFEVALFDQEQKLRDSAASV